MPSAAGAGFGDINEQGLAIFQAGHASSPSWKIAASFFDHLKLTELEIVFFIRHLY